jgi:hypothetical protein
MTPTTDVSAIAAPVRGPMRTAAVRRALEIEAEAGDALEQAAHDAGSSTVAT